MLIELIGLRSKSCLSLTELSHKENREHVLDTLASTPPVVCILYGLRPQCSGVPESLRPLRKPGWTLPGFSGLPCCCSCGAFHYGTVGTYPPTLKSEGKEMIPVNTSFRAVSKMALRTFLQVFVSYKHNLT